MKERLFIIMIFVITAGLLYLSGGKDSPLPAPEPETLVFPGRISVFLTEKNIIQNVTSEEYITGCLYAQIPIDYEEEALKAQACAAATYAMKLMSEKNFDSRGADITDDPDVCQPYFTEERARQEYGGDYDLFHEKIVRAAQYGASHIMTYEGEPVWAVWHAVSAGRTNSPSAVWGRELPPLAPAESLSDSSFFNFECVNEMTSAQAFAALAGYDESLDIPADCAKWFSDTVTDEYGYVKRTKIGKNSFTGGDIWRIFGLRSTCFTVSYRDGIFTFTTKGFGHGAGLSQFGANEMAKNGYTASDILKHYYSENITGV